MTISFLSSTLTVEHFISICEVLISFVGLMFIIIGWIIPHRQALKLERQNRDANLKQIQRELIIQRIDAQLSNYYGPILALLREQEILWNRIHDQICSGPIFSKGQDSLSDLEPEKQKIWVHFVNTYKLPLQRKIINIMSENAHLAEVDPNQTAPYVFLSYVVGWELLDQQKRDGISNYYGYYYSINYPSNFNAYIQDTFCKLQKERNRLLNEMHE